MGIEFLICRNFEGEKIVKGFWEQGRLAFVYFRGPSKDRSECGNEHRSFGTEAFFTSLESGHSV